MSGGEEYAAKFPDNAGEQSCDLWAPPVGDSWDPADLPDDQLAILRPGSSSLVLSLPGSLLQKLGNAQLPEMTKELENQLEAIKGEDKTGAIARVLAHQRT